MNVINEVRRINRLTSEHIFAMKTTRSNGMVISSPRLIFPRYRNGITRISEQEARFSFTGVLEDRNDFFYSVETPTSTVYRFTGAGKRSALFDLCLYEHDTESNDLKLVTACEFKHGGKGINKDIQKLSSLTSNVGVIIGNWFQLINSIDSATIKSLFAKIAEALKQANPSDPSVIIFHFCIMGPQPTILEKVFDCSRTSLSFNSYVDDFFRFDYKVGSGKIVVMNANGWC